MVPASHVLAYAAIVAVLIAVPGPSVLFTISRALTVGRRAALLTVIGNEIGLCVQVGAVALGLGAVVERSAEVVTVIKFVGAAYLVYLGVQAMLILGGLFPVIAFVLDSTWAAVAATVRQWLVRSPRRLALIGGTGGLVMIGLGVSVAATGRKDLSLPCPELFASATHPGGRLPRNKRVKGDQRGCVTLLRR
jgi:threonine/homoserine/homoserine lactone efflux protein